MLLRAMVLHGSSLLRMGWPDRAVEEAGWSEFILTDISGEEYVSGFRVL